MDELQPLDERVCAICGHKAHEHLNTETGPTECTRWVQFLYMGSKRYPSEECSCEQFKEISDG